MSRDYLSLGLRPSFTDRFYTPRLKAAAHLEIGRSPGKEAANFDSRCEVLMHEIRISRPAITVDLKAST